MFTKTRLPHYYYGDDNQDDKIVANNDNISIVEDVSASEPNLSRIPSPASSVASTKKLEWDSGADIGYNNAYNSFKISRRSKSYPSLNMDLSISHINKSDDNETQSDEIENKVVDINKPSTSRNSQCQLKSQDSNKYKFKHSTPYEDKMVRVSKTSLKSGAICQTECGKVDECLQTSMIKNCSKSVQTDSISLKNEQKVNKSLQTDTIKSNSTTSGSSLSKSSSFQYIPGSNTEEPNLSHRGESEESGISKNSSKESEGSNKSKESSCRSILKKNSEKSNSSKPSSVESNSLSASPLAKMIATQQSKHLISDIDKSLTLLQKFIRSKNYTPDTKKYYARKIVNKIIATKYAEDSSSTSGSTSCTNTNKSSEKPIEPHILLKIANSKETPDSSNDENLSPVSRGVQCDPVQKNAATATDKNKKLIKKLEEMVTKNDLITEEAKNKKPPIDLSNKSWKEPETLSEKLFEARRKSSSEGSKNDIDETKKGDYLIQHSKKERKRQLSWISNEISYLHKLKELLQKNDTSSNPSPEIKTPHSHQSTVTNKSPFSDIESRFYQEFGSFASTKSENQDTLKKLLTNDQIKILMDNDDSHFRSCECCKSKGAETPKDNKSVETSKTEYKTADCPSHEDKNHSYNSHNYKFYENLINCNEQPTKKISQKSDAGIQCTLKKKKHVPQPLIDESTISTEYSHDTNNVDLFYKTSKFNQSDSQSTEYGKIEDSLSTDNKRKKHSPNRGKENYCRQRYRNRPECTKSSKPLTEPLAYFLTFEEESMSDFFQDHFRRNALENVTVKVPKMPKSAPQDKPKPAPKPKETKPVSKPKETKPVSKPKETKLVSKPKEPKPSTNQENDENNEIGTNTVPTVKHKILKSHSTDRKHVDSDQKTLQEYLLTNRPEYVRVADWRRSIISDQTDRRSKSIFTCAEMRKQTSKKYNKLPEVQTKIYKSKVLDQQRHNRCMANVFGKKLQRKTLKGELSIATCVNVMSADSL